MDRNTRSALLSIGGFIVFIALMILTESTGCSAGSSSKYVSEVDKIRSNYEYEMKNAVYEARHEGYAEGHSLGLEEGTKAGYSNGYKDGYKEGADDGFESGRYSLFYELKDDLYSQFNIELSDFVSGELNDPLSKGE